MNHNVHGDVNIGMFDSITSLDSPVLTLFDGTGATRIEEDLALESFI